MLWKEKYTLDVPAVDAQHKELFERVETFLRALRSPVSWEEKVRHVNDTLEFMKGYVVEHFRDEEAYQKSIGYTGFESHKRHHDEMVEYVLRLSDAYEKSGCDEQLMQQFAGKLVAWLINHVAAEDQLIGIYAREHKFYTPFLEGASRVFRTMLDLEVDTGLEQEPLPEKELVVSIRVVGDLDGKVIYRFPYDTSMNIVRIMCGMEVTDVDEFVISAVSEMSNIISGNIVTLLAENGYRCDILPPAPVSMQEQTGSSVYQKICYMMTGAGGLCLDVRLNPAD